MLSEDASVYFEVYLAVLSLALPAILRPVRTGWMLIGRILDSVNTRIILGIISLALYTRGFLLKLLQWDPMRCAFGPKAASCLIDSRQPKPENLNRPR